MQNEPSAFDRHGMCRGDAFWKQLWGKYQLCMKGWSWASRGVPWLALEFHGLAKRFQSHELTAAALCVRNFVNPMWHSSTCLFLPMSSSEYFCLFSLHAFTTAAPLEDLFFLPVLSTGQPQSSFPFQPPSPRLCQSFWNVPTLECTPQPHSKGPEWNPKGTSVQLQPMCNRLTSRGKHLATGAGSDQQLESNNKCWGTNVYF